MKRISLSLLILSAGLLAWPNLASSPPPNLETALRVQQDILDREPANAVAWNDLGNLFLVAEQLDRAENAYRRSIELDSANVAAHFNLALLFQQVGDKAEAEKVLRRTLEIDPYHAWAHYQLGVNLEGGRDRAKALEHYARALAYDPGLSFAENNPHVIENEMLGEALLRSQEYSDPPAKRVPRQYGEADRIVDLMLRGRATAEESGTPPGEAGNGGAGGEVGDASFGGGGAADGGLGDGAPGGGATGTADRGAPGSSGNRGLTDVTVGGQPATARRSGATRRGGQSASSPTGATTADPPTDTSTRNRGVAGRRTVTREDLRTGSSASGSSTAPPASRSGDERAVPPPPPPRSSRYIRPSRRSTAQLELKLLPEDAPAARLARLD